MLSFRYHTFIPSSQPQIAQPPPGTTASGRFEKRPYYCCLHTPHPASPRFHTAQTSSLRNRTTGRDLSRPYAIIPLPKQILAGTTDGSVA